MRKTLSIFTMVIIGMIAITQAATVDEAVNRAYSEGLTIYNNASDFGTDRPIRRDEAAKFFVNFAKSIGKTNYVKTASQCQFSDINQAWSDLRDIVIESCELGIFQGSNGKFYPTAQMTNAEATTVLVRIIEGFQSENGVSHWSDNYYNKADQLGVFLNLDMKNRNQPSLRGNQIRMIYSAKDKGYNGTDRNTTLERTYTYNRQTSNYGSCNRECGGGNQTRDVWCERSDGREVNDSYCSGTKPTTSQSCNTQSCSNTNNNTTYTYARRTGNWGSCSTTCGGGNQTREVYCEISDGREANDSYCNGTKPITNQSCNIQSCSTNTQANIDISYSPDWIRFDQGNIVATLTSDKPGKVSGWTADTNRTTFTKTYSSSTTETVTFQSDNGNTQHSTVDIIINPKETDALKICMDIKMIVACMANEARYCPIFCRPNQSDFFVKLIKTDSFSDKTIAVGETAIINIFQGNLTTTSTEEVTIDSITIQANNTIGNRKIDADLYLNGTMFKATTQINDTLSFTNLGIPLRAGNDKSIQINFSPLLDTTTILQYTISSIKVKVEGGTITIPYNITLPKILIEPPYDTIDYQVANTTITTNEPVVLGPFSLTASKSGIKKLAIEIGNNMRYVAQQNGNTFIFNEEMYINTANSLPVKFYADVEYGSKNITLAPNPIHPQTFTYVKSAIDYSDARDKVNINISLNDISI